MKPYVVGVDVGGTNIKLGLVQSRGKVIARTSFPTKSFTSSKTQLITVLAERINAILDEKGLAKKDVAGVGIGLPGLIDYEKGNVRFLPNIPGWRNVPLKSILQKKLGLPVFIDNDVKIITLAEWKFGAGRGAKDMICLTLGTGVGSGLILNGRLYRGPDNAAGELGHMPLNETGPACNCGGSGCLETYIGNQRLLARARVLMGRPITLEEMSALARRADPKALAFWKEVASHLGNALVGVVNLLNPQLIVVGGGVANNHRFLFKTAQEVVNRRAMPTQSAAVKIVHASLGDDAGIIGGQVLVQNG